nr:hypothetical protein [Sedimentibacter sp.]
MSIDRAAICAPTKLAQRQCCDNPVLLRLSRSKTSGQMVKIQGL